MNHEGITKSFIGKNTLFVVFLFSLCVGYTPASTAEGQYDKGLLWKIGSAKHNVSYLFGTIHSEDPRVLHLPEPVTQALVESKHFVMEVEIDPQTELEIAQRMVYLDKGSLAETIGEALFQRAKEVGISYGIPVEAINAMKPWALMVALSMPKSETGMALDLVLQHEAMRRKMEITGLETIGEQLQVFEGLAPKEQTELLADAIDRYPKMNASFEKLLLLYLDRDLAGLLKFSEQEDDSLSLALQQKMTRRLLIERNRRMAKRMEPLITKGGAFVAVGALHLPGRDGLLKLLERMGYEISRVY